MNYVRDALAYVDAWANRPVAFAWESKYRDRQPGYRMQELPAGEEAPPEEWNPETHVRIVCISDTHMQHRRQTFTDAIPAGDVLVHTGDFTNKGLKADLKEFALWMSRRPHPHKVVIAGNHDLTLDPTTRMKRFNHDEDTADSEELKEILRKKFTYLQDESATVAGLKFYGSPYSPAFGTGWGFNQERNTEETRARWAAIPSDTEVLLTHGPPLGVLDLCDRGDRAGCEDLLVEVVNRIRPKLHVFGHIHEGYGKCTNGETVFVNASTCRLHKPRRDLNPPVVVDVPKDGGIGGLTYVL